MSRLKKITPLFYFIAGFLVAIILLFTYSYIYLFSSEFNSKDYNEQLIRLGKESISSKDVPVASIIIYDGKVIGEGKNDVLKNNNPSGHAEINALKDCFEKIGVEEFKKLDRDKLILLTTFEPCTMCRGAIQEYNIKKVVFGYPKSIKDKFNYLKKDFRYFWNLNQSNNKHLQYDLFKLHPTFDSTAVPY
ncbi:MAG: nucleoside deaminase [Raineya sp.]|jgi:tRNA(Arg) A34 adenosine deaminase TadA|nr:nucleoside deaminase [Raineya sp.]